MKPPIYDESWSDAVKALYEHDMQEIWNPRLRPHIWRQYHNQLDLYKATVDKIAQGRPLRILDIGCAQATLALLLAEAGHDVLAVDLRAEFLQYAQTRHTHGAIRFEAANAMDYETGERFDVIFANQLVEHVVRPVPLLARLGALLAAGGTLIVTTPNWGYLVSTLPSFSDLGDVARYEKMEFTADGDGHFFAYKIGELVAFFKQAGLTNIRARYFETPFVSGHMKLRFVQGFFPEAALRALDRATLAAPILRRLFAHQLMVAGVRA